MKFGQNLPRNQVPEWATAYIDYKALKKSIKAAAKATDQGEEADLADFFFNLDRQLENVDTFYNRKYAEFSRRLRVLYERYGMASKMQDGMDKDEMEDLIGTLLELRGMYRKLQWYGEVNRRGFVKITKKLDKKIATSTTAQSRYMATKVDPKPFATNNKLTLDMRAINDWMSTLGDVKLSDDADSIHSSSSTHSRRMHTTTSQRFPLSTLDAVEKAVKEDNVQQLDAVLASAANQAGPDSQRNLRLDLLQRAIQFRAQNAILSLLAQLPSIDHEDDMNKRNCLHKLVIAIGRARALQISVNGEGINDFSKSSYINAAEPPVRAPGNLRIEERDPTNELAKDAEAEKLLAFLLSSLTVEQRSAILTKDVYGRLPLHYAAQYGLASVTHDLIKYMQEWDMFEATDGIDSASWQDKEGYAPLHLAVISGHYRTAKALLLVDDEHQFIGTQLTSKHVEKSGTSLAMATKSNYQKIVRLLVDAGIDVDYQDGQGETALHVAARYGHEECGRILLEGTDRKKASVEIAEKTYGWTPLFIACVDGRQNMVELLIKYGADPTKPDLSGWKPQEHAALRGHLEIARLLARYSPPPSLQPSPNIRAQSPVSQANNTSLGDRRSNLLVKGDSTSNVPRVPDPVKSFGHRYLQEDAMILVGLGSMDERKAGERAPVVLEDIAISNAHATQLDTALSLVISAQGAEGEAVWVDLPIQDNISTSPVTFSARDMSKVKLYFDLVPTYAGTRDKVIGRGVALLSSIKPTIGSNRVSLQGDVSVPLVSGGTLEVLGTVNFNFLIVTPFKHPNTAVSGDRTYWKKSSTMVIGHRGLGKNMNTKTSLQLGENTIQSFITAANLGASYVEFDVQMTKDHVPVIYHDFLVSETGADVPVHSLTLEQFLALGDSTPKPSRAPSPSNGVRPRSRPRSYSAGGTHDGDLRPDVRERMKHTRDFKMKGFKGNLRGDFIQSPFTTLEEMLRTLPPSVGFNIEMKYPMLFETEQEEMAQYAVELNYFVDTVLKQVYDLGAGRNILFSSFHPDICLLLNLKQPSIPVLFLTDAGSSPVGDIRASSLQEAIRFAARWNLLGIVSASEPFVLCPRLIQVVKNSGLVCFSYGTLNNDAENSRLQAQGGIDAVIVDSVARVRKGLTAAEEEAAKLVAAGGLVVPVLNGNVGDVGIQASTDAKDASGEVAEVMG